MTAHKAELRLAPEVYPRQKLPGRRRRHHFLDFVIDGTSLLEAAEQQDQLVTSLSSAWRKPCVRAAIENLLGRGAADGLDSDRIALLVCPECGDLGCGQVTAELAVTDHEVTWRDFRWETGWEEPESWDLLTGSVTFDRSQYEAELDEAARRVALSVL